MAPIRAELVAVFALLSIGFAKPAPAQPACPGDCDRDGNVGIEELVRAVTIALSPSSFLECPAADVDRDDTITVDELVLAVGQALNGCGSSTPDATPSATPRPATDTPTAGPTATLAPARLRLEIRSALEQSGEVCFSGNVVSDAAGGLLSYGCPPAPAPTPTGSCEPVCRFVSSRCVTCGDGGQNCELCPDRALEIEIGGLAAGEWVHHVTVATTGQRQHLRTMLGEDDFNSVHWRIYTTVFDVDVPGDVSTLCERSSTCSFRDAVELATLREAISPILIQFDHAMLGSRAEIRLDAVPALTIGREEIVIDGTDSEGNPSPLAPFSERAYPIRIVLDPSTEGESDTSGILSIRQNANGTILRGLEMKRALAPDDDLRGLAIDQDVIRIGARDTLIDTCLLDGGAQDRIDANDQRGTLAENKDCVDMRTARTGNRIRNSELRFCYDRGARADGGKLSIEDSWVHHNLRGGLLAQHDEELPGTVESRRNLIERNGRNCPGGVAGLCGEEARQTYRAPTQISTDGDGATIDSLDDTIRD